MIQLSPVDRMPKSTTRRNGIDSNNKTIIKSVICDTFCNKKSANCRKCIIASGKVDWYNEPMAMIFRIPGQAKKNAKGKMDL